MTEFTYPALLLAALPVSLLYLWLWRRGPRIIRIPTDEVLPRTRRVHQRVPLLHGLTSWLLALTLLVILAEPIRRSSGLRQRELTNIMIALDISLSMLPEHNDERQDRFAAATSVVSEFTRRRMGDALGLVVFGRRAITLAAPTRDTDALRSILALWHPNRMVTADTNGMAQGTDIAAGLRLAHFEVARASGGDRVVILVTDAQDNRFTATEEAEFLRDWKRSGTELHLVMMGTEKIPPSLSNVAMQTGGGIYLSRVPDELQGVFRRIDDLRAARFETRVDDVQPAHAPWVRLALAFAALHGATALFGLRFTPW